MCRLLIDAMVWNYVAKSGCLDGFLAALSSPPVILPRVVQQLNDAVARWPELASVLQAEDDGRIECMELTSDEQLLQISLLNQHPGLGDVDCALLAVASARRWPLLTCDDRLSRIAGKLKIGQADLQHLLDDAVASNCLTDADRQWVVYHSLGGTTRRPQ